VLDLPNIHLLAIFIFEALKSTLFFPYIMYVHRNISLSWPNFLLVSFSILYEMDIIQDNCVVTDHSLIQTQKQAVYFPLWPCSDSCYKVAERKLFPTTYIQSWELVSSKLQQWRQKNNGSGCHQPSMGHRQGFQEKVWEESVHSSSKWWDMYTPN
jgi:hypothetical protein